MRSLSQMLAVTYAACFCRRCRGVYPGDRYFHDILCESTQMLAEEMAVQNEPIFGATAAATDVDGLGVWL